jgi:hypothetical protein
MSQSSKRNVSQEISAFARRGRAGAAGDDALRHAGAALARAGFTDANLVLRWHEIAGVEVARIARPLKLQEGTTGAVLTVACDPAAIVFLQHETRALAERLNGYLGQGRIARLKLVPGQLNSSVPPPPHPMSGKLKIQESPGDSRLKRSLPEALDRLARVRAKVKDSRPTIRPD